MEETRQAETRPLDSPLRFGPSGARQSSSGLSRLFPGRLSRHSRLLETRGCALALVRATLALRATLRAMGLARRERFAALRAD